MFKRLLALYENVQLRYVSPPNLGMPDEIVKYVASKGIPQEKVNRLEDVLGETDILYMTRIQRERFASQEEYDKVRRLYSVFRSNEWTFKLIIFFFALGIWTLCGYPAVDVARQEQDARYAPATARRRD